METLPPTWIQPEENFLSALIRPPSRPELEANNIEANRAGLEMPVRATLLYRPPQENQIQEQATVRQEWPHPNTATMVEYPKKTEWKTPFLRKLLSINVQWKLTIDSLECEYFDFSSCCQGGIQPRNSHRLGLIRDGLLVCHNRKAYE